MHHPIERVRGRCAKFALAALAVMMIADSLAHADNIRLSTGEVLNVTILEVTDKTIRFAHPLLGEMTLPRESVEPYHLAEVIGLGASLDEANVPEDRDAQLLDGLPERHVRRGPEVSPLRARPEAVVVQVERRQAQLADAAIHVPDLRLLL